MSPTNNPTTQSTWWIHSINLVPRLVVNCEHGSSGDCMPCSGKDTQMHAVTGYDRGRNIALLPHCTSYANTKFTILTPESKSSVHVLVN